MRTISRNRKVRIHTVILAGLASVFFLAGAAGGVLAEDRRVSEIGTKTWTFEIPAQGLRTALQSWSEVTGLDWAHVGGSLEGMVSPGATGALSEGEALRRILAGSGLTYAVLPNGGIAIVRIETEAAV